MATQGTPAGVGFANIGVVTKPTRPPLGGTLHDRLVAHLALSRRSVADAEALRAMLGLYNAQDASDDPVGRANRRRIESILRVATASSTRIVRGGAVRGSSLTLELDEAGFGSAGEAFLFSDVLDRVLGAHTPVHSFSRLVVASHPSGARTEWPARSGDVVFS